MYVHGVSIDKDVELKDSFDNIIREYFCYFTNNKTCESFVQQLIWETFYFVYCVSIIICQFLKLKIRLACVVQIKEKTMENLYYFRVVKKLKK